MRTKHVLMAMLLPAAFAACTQDEFVDVQGVQADLNRPEVGNIQFTLGGDAATRTYGSDGKVVFDKMIGAALMDQPTGTGTEFADKYQLNNYVNTDYPFSLDATVDAWKTTGMLLEGNYFFYYPRKDEGMARQKFEWAIPTEQDAFEGETYNRFAPMKDQMWISYKGLDANTNFDGELLKINLAPAFAELNVQVKYLGESNMEIRKVTIAPNTGSFAVKGILDVTAEGGEDYGFVDVDTLEEASSLAAIYNIYNEVPADSMTIAEKNPLQQGVFLSATENANAISVNFKNQVLTKGKAVIATMLMPANTSADGYNVTIYTDKGVVEYDVLAADTISTVEGSETYQASAIYQNGEYLDVEAAEELTDIIVQGGNSVILSFMDEAVTVDESITVNSTDELDMYMSYYDFQDYEDETEIEVKLNADSIYLSKAGYDVLKGNSNIKFSISRASGAGVKYLYLDSNLPADAMDLIKTNSFTGFNIVAGATQKTVKATDVKNIINNGTLTIEVPAVAPAVVPASKTITKLNNLGTLNVKSPINVTTFENGAATVAPAAIMNLDATVTTTSTLKNYATVNANIGQTWTYEGLASSTGTGANVVTYKPTLTIAAGKAFGTAASTNVGTITNNGILTLNTNAGTITNNGTLTVTTNNASSTITHQGTGTAKVTTNNGTIDNKISVLTTGGALKVGTNSATGEITTVADSQTDIETANNGKIYWVEDAFINGLEDATGSHTEVGNVIYQIATAMTATDLYAKIANVPVTAIEVAAKFTIDADAEKLAQIKAISLQGAEVVANDTVALSNCPVYVSGTGNVISGVAPVVFVPAETRVDYCKIELAKGAQLETKTIIAGLETVNVAVNAKVVARTKVYVNTATSVNLATATAAGEANGLWLGTAAEHKTLNDLATELGITLSAVIP